MLDLMFSYHCLKILNTFEQEALQLYFTLGPANYVSGLVLETEVSMSHCKKNMRDGRYSCGHLWETICHRQLMSV